MYCMILWAKKKEKEKKVVLVVFTTSGSVKAAGFLGFCVFLFVCFWSYFT